VDHHRPRPGCFQRQMVGKAVVRIRASINRIPVLRETGEAGGTWRGKRGALNVAAVVVTVTVTLVPELPAVTGLGETEQAASAGAPLHTNVTLPDIPPWPPTLNV